MHFHPPAKALLQVLPKGAALRIVPEPHNPYDSNALAIYVDADQIPESERDTLETLALPFGYSVDDIIAAGEWHLGYIKATHAVEIVGQVQRGLAAGCLRASLAFGADGKPRVHITFGTE
jgi:hypothetical protein